MDKIQWVPNRYAGEKYPLDFINDVVAKEAYEYHKSFDAYSETPLVELKELAKLLGVKSIYVKDESYRFGLNAFKVLGGSCAIGQYIAGRLGKHIRDLSFRELISDEVKEKLGDITFITATDGNHGRGVAWTAHVLRQKSIVYMPKGSAQERLENIRKLGADASILDCNYDECVRRANAEAEKHGYVMVQDTAWEGYEDIPTWIIQGYATMAYEADLRLKEQKVVPTHVFVQAGVGSMASAMTGYFSAAYPDKKPCVMVVEPALADCLYRTAKANDGDLHFVTDDMNTIMAGLACGEPCTVAWKVLSSYADHFISVPEYMAALGMRVLGNPLKGDERVISGESGAATAGPLVEILRRDEYRELKEKLGLNEDSVVLLFSTEGDTDFDHYRRVCWDGLWACPEDIK